MKQEPYIQKAQKRYFDMIVENLEGIDALRDVDTLGISMMAFDLWMYYEAASSVQEKGWVQTTQSGYSQITADITVMEKCKASFLKFSEKFGLSPKDRERMLKFKNPPNKKDAFDEL